MLDMQSKLAWAQGHLQLLNSEIAKFSNTNPYTLTREDDLENGRHVLRFKLLDVPPQISLIAADAVYNMRSSLDQLVWSLAGLNGIPTKRNLFPIIDDSILTKPKWESFKNSLNGVPPEAICEIDALQPYHRGNAYKTHPLWRLDEMCNLDKHRRIPANGSASVLNFPNLTPEEMASGVVNIQALDEGFVVTVPIALKSKLNLHTRMAFQVNFGGDPSGISESFSGLIQIYKFLIESVMPRFIRFFT